MTIPVIPEEWPEFETFTDILFELSREMTLFEDLFLSEKSSQHELNVAAPEFFFSVSLALRTHILLRLASLFDQPTTGKRRNITVLSVLAQSRSWVSLKDWEHCYRILEDHATEIGILKQFRDKVLAHNDFSTLAGERQFPKLDVNGLRIIFKTLTSIASTIESAVFNSCTYYERISRNTPDDILNVLDAFFALQMLRESPWKSTFSDKDVGAYVKEYPLRRDWIRKCKQYNLDLCCGGFISIPIEQAD